MSRYLVVLALLAEGCEQWKAPKRIHDLEERVDKLSTEVATLKGGSGAPGGKHGDKEGSGSGAGSGEGGGSAGSGSEGSGSASAAGTPGSGSAAEPATGSAAGSATEGADHGKGSATGPEPDAGRQVAAADAGVPDAVSKEVRALQDLRAVVATLGPGGAAGNPRWAYDGKTGPPTWGTLDPAWRACIDGKVQSPIDIEPKAGSASPITFHYKPTPATLYDDGRALHVNFGPGNSIEMDGATYQLLHVQFHTPSEHTIAGERYPLEVQMVHQDTDGKLAILSVLYDVGAAHPTLAEIAAKWPHKVGEDKLGKPVDPSVLLPETRTVFRYPGSLTTPPCGEGVIWNVMRRVPTAAKADLEALARHYPHNVREIQATNGRKIE